MTKFEKLVTDIQYVAEAHSDCPKDGCEMEAEIREVFARYGIYEYNINDPDEYEK